MILLNSTSEYVIAGRSMTGFPILLNSDMSSCLEVNEFLRFYLLRAQIESTGSWEPIGRSLYDYFGFLEAHGLVWSEASCGSERNFLAAYRDYCFKTARLARNTIILRITYICEFYKYALRQGWIKALPYHYERRHHVIRSANFLTHVTANHHTPLGNSSTPRRHRSLIKFLSLEQARLLLRAATNVHHAAIIRTGLLTGLRREELATLPAAYIFDPKKSTASGNNFSIVLDPSDGSGMHTKGSKPRTIYIDRQVMGGLYRYKSICRGERSSLTSDRYPNLFLNRDGRPFAKCGKGLEAIIRSLGNSVNIRAYPHMLRHTYATHTLYALQRRTSSARSIEPLVFLQRQLGHSSINTTMEYLHLVDQIASEAALSYDAELSFWRED